jgi:ATP-dependent Clp protease ATP-binding subunit ClpA
VIQKELGDRLAMALLEGHYAEGGTVKVDVEGDQLALR